ncbi:MAG TPA: hypothetical protein VGM10_28175 [Actinocrinis sp.]
MSARPARNRLLAIGRTTTGFRPVTRATAIAYSAGSTDENSVRVRSAIVRTAGPSACESSAPFQ